MGVQFPENVLLQSKCIADPDGIDPDPNSTGEKKLDEDPILEKQTGIGPYLIKFTHNFQ